jgi:hypothetical protein
MSLKDSFFKKVLSESEIEISVSEKDKEKSYQCDGNCFVYCIHKTMNFLYRVIKILYSTFYFYFAPFTVFILSLYKLDYA